ncbi:hypothetical protein FQ187_18375 [Pseudomonas sp. ANT_J28]|nr:hypothetical protein FQ187_18375 [Pseudomonas sp. ANT_J28]
MATHENDLMDGQRAVFERGILAQRPLLIRTQARSKGHMNIPPRLGRQMGFGQSMKMCSRAKRRAR